MVETRPYIAFAISIISCFIKNPGYKHIEVVKTILQYLKGSRKCGIIYGDQNELSIEEYSDFDWASDKESRKLTLDFIFILNRGPVS